MKCVRRQNPDITTFQLFLYLGRLLHLIRQIGRERGDGQLCVGGDLEAAGEALDDAVHFWVVVQGNVFSFPEKYHRMPMMYNTIYRKEKLPNNKNSYGNVMRLCDWDVSYGSLSVRCRVPDEQAV